VKLYTPKEINLKADYAAKDKHSEKVDGYVAHRPGVDREYSGELHESMSALRGIESHSMKKNWWGIPYDYAVDLSGNKFLLRGTARSGATSGDYDEDGIPNNDESDAFLLLLGNKQKVSRKMMNGVQDLVDKLGKRKYFIGHMEAKGITTSCPGNSVMDDIVGPLSRGENLRNAPEPSHSEPPAPTSSGSGWRKDTYDSIPVIDLSGVASSPSSTWVRGNRVRVVQGLLVANGFAPANTIRPDGSLDGIGGPGTRAALVDAQRKLRLTADSIAGPDTYEKLVRGLVTINLQDVSSDYRTWVRGLNVAVLQALLVAAGFAPDNTIDSDGNVDGVAGPATKRSLKSFQSHSRLSPDAIVGPNTYKSLLIK
jgi:peptidoglycan hydrolase-like protein with peptidoglycan-binding domain